MYISRESRESSRERYFCDHDSWRLIIRAARSRPEAWEAAQKEVIDLLRRLATAGQLEGYDYSLNVYLCEGVATRKVVSPDRFRRTTELQVSNGGAALGKCIWLYDENSWWCANDSKESWEMLSESARKAIEDKYVLTYAYRPGCTGTMWGDIKSHIIYKIARLFRGK